MKTFAQTFVLIIVCFVIAFASGFRAYGQSAGGKIVFDNLTNGRPDVYVINADGSGQTKLTTSGGMHPTWSPDGKRIAFVKSPQSGSYVGDIYVMNSDGSNPVNITNSTKSEDCPSWSPNGSMIAFMDNTGIKVMNVNGGNVKTVVSGARNKVSWSPDNSKIAFTQMNSETGSLEIYTTNIDGSNLKKLTNGESVSYPAWSPDGSKIAFIYQYQIYVMNSDGSNRKKISSDQTIYSGIAWSPDGTKFVCDGDRDIYIVNATSGAKTKLTNTGRTGNSNQVPEWQSSGNSVASSVNSNSQQNSTEPTLTETINWIRKTIEAESFSYTIYFDDGKTVQTTVQQKIINFDDCHLEFENIHATNGYSFIEKVKSVLDLRHPNLERDGFGKEPSDRNQYFYVGFGNGMAQKNTSTYIYSDGREVVNFVNRVGSTPFYVKDPQMADRVIKALYNAAKLCRQTKSTEPF